MSFRDELMAVECIDECYDAEYKCRAACKGDTVCIYECTQDRESEMINRVFYKENNFVSLLNSKLPFVHFTVLATTAAH